MPWYSSAHIGTSALLFKFQPRKPLGLDYIEIIWVTLHCNSFPAFTLWMNCDRFWCVERGWEVWKHKPWVKKHSSEGSCVGRRRRRNYNFLIDPFCFSWSGRFGRFFLFIYYSFICLWTGCWGGQGIFRKESQQPRYKPTCCVSMYLVQFCELIRFWASALILDFLACSQLC